MFDISFRDEPIDELEPCVTEGFGRITIGDFREDLSINLFSWNQDRYKQQWKAAVARLVSGADKSALIVEYVEPPHSHNAWLWPMYREGSSVYIQNRLLFFDQLQSPFSPDSPWDSIGERSTVSSTGDPISEWVTSVDSLQDFLKRID